MTRIPAHGRLPVEDSLFDRLLQVRPDLPVLRATKATLVASSHLVETLVERSAERCVLVSGFQHGRHWAVERDRYLGLAGEHDVIAVFAGQEPLRDDVDHVGLRLRTGDPLAQEWFVLAVGPGLAITLCGLDGDAHGRRDEPVLEATGCSTWCGASTRRWPRPPPRSCSEAVARSGTRTRRRSPTGLRRRPASARRRPAEAARRRTRCWPAWSSAWRRCGCGAARPRGGEPGEEHVPVADEPRAADAAERRPRLRPAPRARGVGRGDAEAVAQILAAGRHLVVLVDELLDIGRIEAGELHLEVEALPVADLCAEVLAMMQPLAQARSLTVDDRTAGGAHLGARRPGAPAAGPGQPRLERGQVQPPRRAAHGVGRSQPGRGAPGRARHRDRDVRRGGRAALHAVRAAERALVRG
jgi:hypothetical protein